MIIGLLPDFLCLSFLHHELTCFFFLPLDYLLSNNYVNSIIVHKFDFSDEEIMAYYISFLKTLSLKLNNHTVHFFYNEVSGCWRRGAFGCRASWSEWHLLPRWPALSLQSSSVLVFSDSHHSSAWPWHAEIFVLI